MARVTVVNDNLEFLELMGEILEGERYDTTTIQGDALDVVERIRASRPGVLVLDLRLANAGLHGWDVAQQLRRRRELQDLPVLICSADLQVLEEVERELEGQPAVAVLPKPFSIEQLTARIEGLLSASR